MKQYWNQLKIKSKGAPLTWIIIGVCCLVWLLEVVTQGAIANELYFAPALAWSEPWRWVTALFLHSLGVGFGGLPIPLPIHLAFNMYALYQGGQIVERFLGSAKFAIIYFVSGLAGHLFFYLFALASFNLGGGGPTSANALMAFYSTAVLGASGAVFGIFAACILLVKKLGANARQMIISVGISLLLSFAISGIAWQAHIGGLLGGLAATWLILNQRQRPR